MVPNCAKHHNYGFRRCMTNSGEMPLALQETPDYFGYVNNTRITRELFSFCFDCMYACFLVLKEHYVNNNITE